VEKEDAALFELLKQKLKQVRQKRSRVSNFQDTNHGQEELQAVEQALEDYIEAD
jgi:hypothetical protein